MTQFHFTSWPDHGVPDYATAILMFHTKVLASHDSSDGPILVHCRLNYALILWSLATFCFTCSAGVGRTGTFITIDIVQKQVQKEGVVDIYNIIEKLRRQRPHMVQTLVCAIQCKLFFYYSYNNFCTGAIYVYS